MSLFYLQLCLFDSPLLLFDGVAQFILIEDGQCLPATHLLTVPHEYSFNGQGRLKREVGEVSGHHLAHSPDSTRWSKAVERG